MESVTIMQHNLMILNPKQPASLIAPKMKVKMPQVPKPPKRDGGEPTLGLGSKLLAAGLAACMADVVTFPLDTAKVRLQVRFILLYYLHVIVAAVQEQRSRVATCQSHQWFQGLFFSFRVQFFSYLFQITITIYFNISY